MTVVSVEQHSDMPFDLSLLVDAAAPQRLHCEVLYLHDWGEVHFPSQIQIQSAFIIMRCLVSTTSNRLQVSRVIGNVLPYLSPDGATYQ